MLATMQSPLMKKFKNKEPTRLGKTQESSPQNTLLSKKNLKSPT